MTKSKIVPMDRAALLARENEIRRLRDQEGLTLREIGGQLNISPVRVFQIEAKSKRKERIAAAKAAR